MRSGFLTIKSAIMFWCFSHALVSTVTAVAAAAAAGTGTLNLTVDLGYAAYKGVENRTTGLSAWKGIRYAAPPVGKLRWQAPRDPDATTTGVISADDFGPVCPQQMPAVGGLVLVSLGDEDCLFLNVYAPSARGNGTTLLPVLVEIHGGGYGLGDGRLDVTGLMNTNENGFVVVTIQYRLGAFGFLSSEEVKSRGVLNAGMLDQEFALRWVQKHISKFGGDPRRVTIAGESAGGGSVMLHAIARDGTLGTSLFRNLIAASPYLPTQPRYNDAIPTERYRVFAAQARCPSSGADFDCLVSADSETLRLVNRNMTAGDLVPWANWAFIPVTDGAYISEATTARLNKSAVNGVNLLSAGNANEGDAFVPSGISTLEGLKRYINSNFVNLSPGEINAVLEAYPSVPGPDDPDSPRFETTGFGPATAVNTSQVATGHQQRAYSIYAESTFVCPAYWLADAFGGGNGRASFYYQYSVPFASHGTDQRALIGIPTPNQGPDFVNAFRKIYGNFVTKDNPSIENSVANGLSSKNPAASNGASSWPRWTVGNNPLFLNLNQTGGTPTSLARNGVNVTQFTLPGLTNSFTVAEANPWEGGRGRRCDFWRALSPSIPQ